MFMTYYEMALDGMTQVLVFGDVAADWFVIQERWGSGGSRSVMEGERPWAIGLSKISRADLNPVGKLSPACHFPCHAMRPATLL